MFNHRSFLSDIGKITKESHCSPPGGYIQKGLSSIINFKSLVLLLLVIIVLMLLLLFYTLLRMEGNITDNVQSNCKSDDIVSVLPANFSDEDTHVIIENTAGPLILTMPHCFAVIHEKRTWYSSPFFAFTRGYKMLLQVDATSHDGFLSIYLRLMKGPYDDELQQSGQWPMQGVMNVEILHKSNGTVQEDFGFLFCNQLCSECNERVTNNQDFATRKYLGDKVMLLDKLIRNFQHHKSDTLYFRISYHTCHSCAVIVMEGRRLLLYLLYHMFDYMSMFILLLIIRVHKLLTKHFRLVFSLQVLKISKYNLQMIHRVLYMTMCRNLVFAGFLFFLINLPFFVLDNTNLLNCDTAFFLYYNALRVYVVFAYSHAVGVYSFTNNQYIILNPVWFLAIISQAPIQGDTMFSLLIILNMLLYKVIVTY